ncbi:MAG: ABC transporter substrate-binding protein [Rhizomicrobium sp.]|jgi:phospholipid transport system substrate-binding protein
MAMRARSMTLPAMALTLTVMVLGPFCWLSQAARADNVEEAFVQQSAGKTLAILKDKALSSSDKHARMHDLMSSLLDLKRMAMFTLGPAAHTASPTDLDLYVRAYSDFALANYAAELTTYMGQSLQVTGSAQRAKGDFIVNAEVIDPNDKADGPTAVSFRVLDEGGGQLALVDASVAGIWFTLAQRDDFSGFLSQNGGDISKLAAHLNDLSAHPKPAARTNP